MESVNDFLFNHDNLWKDPKKNEASLASEKHKLEVNLLNCTCTQVLTRLTVSDFHCYHEFGFKADTVLSFLLSVKTVKKQCKVCVTICHLGFIWVIHKYGIHSLYGILPVPKEPPHITAITCKECDSNPTFAIDSKLFEHTPALTWIETIITFLINNHSSFCNSINSLSLVPFVQREHDFKKQAAEEILNLKSQLQIVDPIVNSNVLKNIKTVPFGCEEITFEGFRTAELMANRPGQNPNEFVFNGMIPHTEFESLYTSSKLSESPSRQVELLNKMRSSKSVNPFSERYHRHRHLSSAPFAFNGKELRCEICEIPFTIYSENSKNIWFHLSSTGTIDHFFHPVCLTLAIASQNKGIPITRQSSAQSQHDFRMVPFVCLSPSCCDKNRIIRIQDLCSTNFGHLKKSQHFSELQPQQS